MKSLRAIQLDPFYNLFYLFGKMMSELNGQSQPDAALLLQLVPPNGIKMPFGKYKGSFLCDLPVAYLEWFQRKGFPKGKIGLLLGTIYEIKINGLAHLLTPFKRTQAENK